MRQRRLLSVSFFIFSTSICAKSLPAPDFGLPAPAATSMDVVISGGVSFSHLSNEVAVPINNVVINNYISNQTDQINPFLSIGIGHTFQDPFPNQRFALAVDLAVSQIDFGKVSGIEYPFANISTSDPLNYNYKVSSTSLLLESKLIDKSSHKITFWEPYVLVGLGVAWNELSEYSETPVDPCSESADIPEVFHDHTHVDFAYELGVGVQRHLFTSKKYNALIAFDYRTINFGLAALNPFSSQTTPSGIRVTNLDTQALMMTLIASFV